MDAFRKRSTPARISGTPRAIPAGLTLLPGGSTIPRGISHRKMRDHSRLWIRETVKLRTLSGSRPR